MPVCFEISIPVIGYLALSILMPFGEMYIRYSMKARITKPTKSTSIIMYFFFIERFLVALITQTKMLYCNSNDWSLVTTNIWNFDEKAELNSDSYVLFVLLLRHKIYNVFDGSVLNCSCCLFYIRILVSLTC